MKTQQIYIESGSARVTNFNFRLVQLVRLLLLIILLSSTPELMARSLGGRIIDAISSQPLPYTNVLLLEAGEGTTADNSGYFNFQDVPAGTYTLQVAHIGYAQVRKTVDISTSNKQSEFIQLQLHQEALTGEKIVVSATAADFQAESGLSRSSLNYRDLSMTPSFVEADLFRTIKNLPGVVSQNDFSAAFVVRGGRPDENLILLDGMEIYNPYHFGGIFSVFNTQAIENVNFQSGGFSAEYGGRLSSVVSAHTRTGSERAGVLQRSIPGWQFWDVNDASVSLSLLSASAQIEGPLHKGSYSITGRRTYFDKLSSAVNKKSATVPEIPYYFYDVQWNANTELSPRHRLYFSGYSGMDDLSLSLGGAETLTYQTDFAWNWGNEAQSVRVHSMLSPNLLLKSTLGQSMYRLNADLSTLDMNYEEMHAENTFIISNRLESLKFSEQIYWSPPGNHTFSGGISAQKYDISLGLTGNRVKLLNNRANPLLISLYAQDQYQFNSRLQIEGGLRAYHYSASDRPWLDLRSSLRYRLTHRTNLKAALGSYTQFLFTTNQNSDVIRIVDFYNAVPRYQKPERANHFIVGLDHALTTASRISLEAYYKPYSNILITNPLQRLSEADDDFISGTGQAYGLDAVIKQERGLLTGWLAYSYAHSIRQVDLDSDGVISGANGEIFRSRYDIRHSLHLSLLYQLNRNQNVGLTWNWSSGLPYTPVIGKRYGSEGSSGWYQPYSETSEITKAVNSGTMPSYLRGDLSFQQKFRFPGGTGALNIQIINFTNHFNVLLFKWDHSQSNSRVDAVSMFPIIPTLGITINV